MEGVVDVVGFAHRGGLGSDGNIRIQGDGDRERGVFTLGASGSVLCTVDFNPGVVGAAPGDCGGHLPSDYVQRSR